MDIPSASEPTVKTVLLTRSAKVVGSPYTRTK